jgi:hypothetical protein
MGMFDYLSVSSKHTLPQLPVEFEEGHCFQTKCTPAQYMTHYHIDDNGCLIQYKDYYNHIEDDSVIGGARSVFERTEEIPVTGFNGDISFYDSYGYSEDVRLEWRSQIKHVPGWIEYKATFLDGKLVKPIELVKNTEPFIRTDEEVEEIIREAEARRKEYREKAMKQRKELPTASQKAMDVIFNLTDTSRFVIPDIEDYSRALKDIRNTITEYREKHDTFYE